MYLLGHVLDVICIIKHVANGSQLLMNKHTHVRCVCSPNPAPLNSQGHSSTVASSVKNGEIPPLLTGSRSSSSTAPQVSQPKHFCSPSVNSK